MSSPNKASAGQPRAFTWLAPCLPALSFRRPFSAVAHIEAPAHSSTIPTRCISASPTAASSSSRNPPTVSSTISQPPLSPSTSAALQRASSLSNPWASSSSSIAARSTRSKVCDQPGDRAVGLLVNPCEPLMTLSRVGHQRGSAGNGATQEAQVLILFACWQSVSDRAQKGRSGSPGHACPCAPNNPKTCQAFKLRLLTSVSPCP
eukprot:scaffold280626_cov19-Tisochrysis_lutea.AAC.1